MNIVLIGMKSSGKSTVGKLLARRLGYLLIELDYLIEKKYLQFTGIELTVSEIFKKHKENKII